MTLFTLDQPEGAYDDRAYTRIDLNRAVVGNRWLERTWSAFFGTTTSIIQKAGDVEWAAPSSPDFRFTVDDTSMDSTILDEISISEDASEMGATIHIRKSKGGVDAVYSTTALHDSPLLMRKFSITNSGNEPITVTNVCTEHVVWDSPNVDCWVRKFTEIEKGTWSASGEDANLSIQIRDKGLIFGVIEPGLVHLERDETPACRATAPDSAEIAPLQTWEGPSSYLIAFEGDPFDAHTQHYTALLNELRLQEKRTVEIQRLLAEEE